MKFCPCAVFLAFCISCLADVLVLSVFSSTEEFHDRDEDQAVGFNTVNMAFLFLQA